MFHKHNYRSCLPLYLNAHHRPFWNIFLLFKFFTFNHFKYDLLVFSGGVHCIFDNDSFDIKNSFMQYKNGDSYFPWKLRARRSGDSRAVGNLSRAPLPSASCRLRPPSERSWWSFSSLRVDGPSRDLFSWNVTCSFEQQVKFFLLMEHGFFSDASEHAALLYPFCAGH